MIRKLNSQEVWQATLARDVLIVQDDLGVSFIAESPVQPGQLAAFLAAHKIKLATILRRSDQVESWALVLQSQLGEGLGKELRIIQRKRGTEFRYFAATSKLQAAAEPESPSSRQEQNPEKSPEPKKVRLMILDDSPTVTKVLDKLFRTSDKIEVSAIFNDPLKAKSYLASHRVDVVTLDINMPHMDGVQFLREVCVPKKIPTIMISAVARSEGEKVLEALELGAIDHIQKPSFEELGTLGPLILDKVLAAASARLVTRPSNRRTRLIAGHGIERSLILLGASTGGTEALRELLFQFPERIPPTLIVQHIPAVFSKSFADRLDSLLPFSVREAVDGDLVTPNQVLVAPGGFQMKLQESPKGLTVAVTDEAPVNRHRPSVDVLFDSATAFRKTPRVAAILTGMGADGAKAMKRLRESGCRTVAQDEASCVVYGMPRAAAEIGAAERVEPLDNMGQTIFNYLNEFQRKLAA